MSRTVTRKVRPGSLTAGAALATGEVVQTVERSDYMAPGTTRCTTTYAVTFTDGSQASYDSKVSIAVKVAR